MKKHREKYLFAYCNNHAQKKIILLLLLIVISLRSFATSYAQEYKISINIQKGTFYEIISEIENQSDFMFFYDTKNGFLKN